MSPDIDLVRRVLSGDRDAAATLDAMVRRLVFGLARARFGIDHHAAEDLLQACLTRLWENDCRALRSWRGNGRFTTYVTVIATHLWSREHTGSAHPEHLDLSVAREPIDATPTPEERLATKEQRRAIERAMRALRPRDRLMVTLRFIDGHRPKEIAQMLGMSPGATRKAIHDANRRLKAQLQIGDRARFEERRLSGVHDE